MSSNYPEGSMRGSGIYVEDYTGNFYCSNCDTEEELEGSTDDWGLMAYAECLTCEATLEVELPSREELADDYWADYQEGK
jgi:transcription elongation factor Elf1